MIVTTDEGSDYSTPPSLTCEWDATGGALAAELENLQISGDNPPPPDHPDYVKKYHVAGQKIQVYHSIAGPQSFWRFKLEIPLGEREEEIFYSINVSNLSTFIALSSKLTSFAALHRMDRKTLSGFPRLIRRCA
jgi:hypothetical protein